MEAASGNPIPAGIGIAAISSATTWVECQAKDPSHVNSSQNHATPNNVNETRSEGRTYVFGIGIEGGEGEDSVSNLALGHLGSDRLDHTTTLVADNVGVGGLAGMRGRGVVNKVENTTDRVLI